MPRHLNESSTRVRIVAPHQEALSFLMHAYCCCSCNLCACICSCTLQNPYIFAALSIATIIPQNSTTTSLNSLVILFYDSGLFMNFAEAVYCVRLVTWLSILCCLLSFAIFS